MTTAVQPATQRRKLSRDDVLRMGRSGAPWGFVPVAAQVLRLAPDDHVLRAMMAANLAALGLKTAALEVIELLPEEARRDGEVAELEQATRVLPSDRIPALELIRTCRANLAALPSGSVELEPVAAEWERKLGAWEWMRARGGNVVRREPGSVDVAQWRGLCDQMGAAEGFGQRHFATDEDTHGPLTIEGLDPPWIFLEAVKAFPERADGFVRRIRVVQADAMELLDGLAQADLTEPFSSGRVELFVGADCSERLAARLGELHGVRIQGPYVPLPSLRTRAEPATDAVLRDAVEAQKRELIALQAVVRDKYTGRDAAWWRRRYRDALRGGEPLRVLVPTCRYSTFIQHSSRDLVGALERAGCTAELLLEPDPFSHFSLVAYERVCARYEPDLVVLINYPRSTIPGAFPDNVPFVCWIQDAMPQLFQSSVSKPTRLDFVAGHVYDGAAALDGFPPDAALQFPVPVSEAKFHNGQVSEHQASRFTCDIAYVSHQSETADAFHQRVTEQDTAERMAVFNECRDTVRAAMDAWCDEPQYESLQRAKHTLAAGLDRSADDSLSDRLWHHYIHPLAERMLRHETLAWAADIAREHGLQLRIFGNGWEQHPTLSKYAAGPVAHGDELRACYQTASVQLHASIHGCGHQRVFECALSGGLPLCRRSWGELYRHDWARITEFMNRQLPPDASLVKWRWPAYVIDNHPELREILEYRARLNRPRLGWDHEHFEHVYAQVRNDDFFKYWDAPLPPEQMRPVEILGDPLELTFSTREDLETRILRAVHDPTWRAQTSVGVADRVRSKVTMRRFAEQLLELVCTRLASPVNTSVAETIA